MRHYKTNLILGVMVFFFLCGVTNSTQALTITHNGTLDSLPPGTGDVDVRISEIGFPSFTWAGSKTFFENATHNMTLGDPNRNIAVTETVFNRTETAWNGFHIDVLGSDFLGFDQLTLAPEENPVVPIETDPTKIWYSSPDTTISSSMIKRNAEMASLWIFFDKPIDPTDFFSLEFSFFDPDRIFHVKQAPKSVPEPVTMLLLGFGIIALIGISQKIKMESRRPF
jgi:hypothetical protein